MPQRTVEAAEATVVVDDEAWKKITSVFPSEWEAIARESGLGAEANRPHNASRVDAGLIVRTLLTLVASNLTLRFTSTFFAERPV
jgi:hypothetical protein